MEPEVYVVLRTEPGCKCEVVNVCKTRVDGMACLRLEADKLGDTFTPEVLSETFHRWTYQNEEGVSLTLKGSAYFK